MLQVVGHLYVIHILCQWYLIGSLLAGVFFRCLTVFFVILCISPAISLWILHVTFNTLIGSLARMKVSEKNGQFISNCMGDFFSTHTPTEGLYQRCWKNCEILVTFLALHDYISRAHEIEIRTSSVPPSSVSQLSLNLIRGFLSFEFWLLLPLGHTLTRLFVFFFVFLFFCFFV